MKLSKCQEIFNTKCKSLEKDYLQGKLTKSQLLLELCITKCYFTQAIKTINK